MIDDGTTGRSGPRSSFIQRHSLADTRLARLGFVSPAERDVLATVSLTARSFGAGDNLVHAGTAPESLFFLTAGWACRYVTMRTGERQITVLMVPGSVCNLDNLLFERADFAVRAITRTTVLTLPRDHAVFLAARYSGIGRAFTWLALAENAILSQWAVGLGRRNAAQRLAHFLCEMHVRLGGDSDFELPLTQELIADALGLTGVHVNRVIQRLRAQDLVRISNGTVTILDSDRLCALAEFDRSYLDQIEASSAVPSLGSA